MKSKFTIFLLAAGLVLASSDGFAAGSDVSANFRLMAFGNAAELKSVTNAVARFNQKYPNVRSRLPSILYHRAGAIMLPAFSRSSTRTMPMTSTEQPSRRSRHSRTQPVHSA